MEYTVQTEILNVGGSEGQMLTFTSRQNTGDLRSVVGFVFVDDCECSNEPTRLHVGALLSGIRQCAACGKIHSGVPHGGEDRMSVYELRVAERIEESWDEARTMKLLKNLRMTA